MWSLFCHAVFLHPVVHDDVAVSVFDPEPPRWVVGFLPAVTVDGLHRAVWILPLLVVSCVDLPLACVEKDFLRAVPERSSTHWHPVGCYLRRHQVKQTTRLFELKEDGSELQSYGLTWMTVPSVSTLSSLPSGNRFFTVWSGKVISLRPSGKCFSEAETKYDDFMMSSEF